MTLLSWVRIVGDVWLVGTHPQWSSSASTDPLVIEIEGYRYPGEPSIRDYFDNRWHAGPLGPDDFVEVPTAVTVFDNHFLPEGTPPREWAERLYNVRRWTPMPRGGHFAPAEEPELLARDIAAFFGELSS